MKIGKVISRTTWEEIEIDLPYFFTYASSVYKVTREQKVISVFYVKARVNMSVSDMDVSEDQILQGKPCTEQEFEETKAKVLEVITNELKEAV